MLESQSNTADHDHQGGSESGEHQSPLSREPEDNTHTGTSGEGTDDIPSPRPHGETEHSDQALSEAPGSSSELTGEHTPSSREDAGNTPPSQSNIAEFAQYGRSQAVDYLRRLASLSEENEHSRTVGVEADHMPSPRPNSVTDHPGQVPTESPGSASALEGVHTSSSRERAGGVSAPTSNEVSEQPAHPGVVNPVESQSFTPPAEAISDYPRENQQAALHEITTTHVTTLYQLRNHSYKPMGGLLARDIHSASLLEDAGKLRRCLEFPEIPYFITEVQVPAGTTLTQIPVSDYELAANSVIQYLVTAGKLPQSCFKKTRPIARARPTPAP